MIKLSSSVRVHMVMNSTHADMVAKQFVMVEQQNKFAQCIGLDLYQ